MKLSREEVLHIARLARVGVTDEEVGRMSEQLSHILESFQALQEVDTEGVPPTAQPNELRNVIKADKTRPSLPQEEALANAPAREGEFIRVRAVLE
jgi:aspartyl-tRNA(Asn)/glutamyl-tRNA(Gln) amidotransferase subunit C